MSKNEVINGKVVAVVVTVDADLDAPSASNPLQEFEYSLPFCRSAFLTFYDHVVKAEKACGGEGFVTLDALAKEFTSQAWSGLADDESIVSQVLLSSAFKDETKGQTAAQIDKNFLILFGILHCQGTPKDKAEKWYGILQEGGKSVHPKISANDKDMVPVVKKMCDFVTCDVFSIFAPMGSLPNPYTDE